jgi:hypothetical protein
MDRRPSPSRPHVHKPVVTSDHLLLLLAASALLILLLLLLLLASCTILLLILLLLQWVPCLLPLPLLAIISQCQWRLVLLVLLLGRCGGIIELIQPVFSKVGRQVVRLCSGNRQQVCGGPLLIEA